MTLSFSTQIDGKPTYFIEKIWNGFNNYEIGSRYYIYNELFRNQFGKIWDLPDYKIPKIHTIRADKKDRWKVGNKIHFVINNRTKDRFQFAPVILVKSVQKIKINPDAGFGMKTVIIDGVALLNQEIEVLAQNDGFDSADDFFKYFDSYFTGKIIHWTDFSYCG